MRKNGICIFFTLLLLIAFTGCDSYPSSTKYQRNNTENTYQKQQGSIYSPSFKGSTKAQLEKEASDALFWGNSYQKDADSSLGWANSYAKSNPSLASS